MATPRKQMAIRILAVIFSASLMLTYVACNSSSPDQPQATTQDPPEGEKAEDAATPAEQYQPQFDLNEALSKSGTVRPPKPKEGKDQDPGSGGAGLFGDDDAE